MSALILGLVLFLGIHSVRIFAEPLRAAAIARLGNPRWKALYSLVSLLGLALIVSGYAGLRETPVDLWHPPVWTRHLAAALMLPSFMLLTAAYVPQNRVKAAVGHPMIVGVKVWALAHLLANGRLADVVLFGAFLVWAVLDFRAARQRDRRDGVRRTAGEIHLDLSVAGVGFALWTVFSLVLHGLLIGVAPFG